MYGDTERGGAATALRFVTCDLSSLTDCGCMTSAESDLTGSSNKRKTRSSGSLIDPDSFTALSAKRLILGRPTLIDRLISRNKTALEEMEGKKRGPGRPSLSGKSKVDPKENLKRKRTESMNGSSPAVKRLRSAKTASESDSSESRNTSIERKRGRPPADKPGDKKSPKKPNRKIERRCSVRIHYSSLRSGKKRKELQLAMKQRRIRTLSKDGKGKSKWNGQDKTDTNSNVCPENESNDEIDESTDSEMSRGPSELSELPSEVKIMNDKQKSPDEDVKKKKKRRKRDSMWVRKVKKQIKAKVENADLAPSAIPTTDDIEKRADEGDEEEEDILESLEASDIPILDKESDESLVADDNSKTEITLNNCGIEDVAMPKLEKEVDIPSEKNESLQLDIKVDQAVPSQNVNSEILEEGAENSGGTGVSSEEVIPDNLSSPLNSPLDLPSKETNVPEDSALEENSIKSLPSEENVVKDESVNIRESETVENENKELNISNEKIEEVSNPTNVQDDELKENTSIEDTDDQVHDSLLEENMEIPENEDSKPVINDNDKEELNSVEEDNLKDSEPKSEIEGSLPDNDRSETETVGIDSKIMGSTLNGDVIEKTENRVDILSENGSEPINTNIDIKEEPPIDADSTSDVKPSLDDSFPDFSLSLPDDLELDSSMSDDHDERTLGQKSDHVFPDSTEQTKLPDPKAEENVSSPPTTESSATDQTPVNSAIDSTPELKDKDVEEQQKSDAIDETVIDENVALNDNQEKPDPKTAEDMLSEILDKDKSSDTKYEELTTEQRQMKESVLQALGLKSLTPQQPEEKPKRDGYTGTLKAVIKLNRSGDKKRMVYRRSEDSMGELEYRICSEIPSTDGVPITHLNDIAGIRKNVSKLHHDSDVSTTNTSHGTSASNGHAEDHETNNHDESKGTSAGKESNLIIPEKSSSFSIHPGKLCSDVCSYCFGKFGCLDTPCHIAQLKTERQNKILASEPHLTAESCLCDACYRYVDRKANCTKSAASAKTKVRPPASSQCCVNHCTQKATHTVKKKWLVKLKKSITNKVQSDKLDIDLDKSAAMYFPLCAQHHYWVDYFTVCGICRKRLNRNHLYSLGAETDRLNLMLAEDGIPARLSDKLFLCKLCRYYSNLRLKYADPGSIPSSGRIFYRDYRRKILMSLDIPISDSDEEQIKEEKKKGLKKPPTTEGPINTNGAGPSTKSEESMMSLSNLATLLGDQPEQQARIQVKFGNVNIGRLSNLNIGQGGREERPYSDVGLQANLEFQGPAVPDGSWERCTSTIQFDKRTKKLWQDLQKPYGNQSSFLRHLVMLEKYWRAGYLCLAQGADERAAKYLNGVKNRIKAFEGSSEKPSATPVPSTPPTSTNEKFPLITNTGEIEVTPLKVAQKKVSPPVMIEKKQMTPLDRAKSLVRMIQPNQRFPAPMQRYQVPMYLPYGYAQAQQPHHPQQRPPPLLKIRNKAIPQAYYSTMPGLTATQNLKPILPKLPRALTVTQVPQGGPAITLNRSGITIEKQSGGSPVMPALPIEKPSISVFREPAPGPP